MDTLDEVLAHHGIRGMKWGVRRKRSSSSSSSSSSPNHGTSEDAHRARELHSKAKKHGTHSLTNQELQHVVTRLNLEQQYSRVTSQQHSKVKKGQSAVREIVGVGRTVADAVRLGSDVSKAFKVINKK